MKNKIVLLILILMTLAMVGCGSGDNNTDPFANQTYQKPVSSNTNDATTPWLATATSDPWLTTNPYGDKHDGGWVYSAREDRLYSMYGNDNDGRTFFRINHIGETYEIATTFTYGHHGSQPVIDDTGTYIYMPPSYENNDLERYNTETSNLETLASAPASGYYTHGTWKKGKLWVVLGDHNLYSYNPAANTWSASLHVFANQANVATSDSASNLIYIIVEGGDFFSYDVTNNATTTLPSHPFGFSLSGNGQLTWFGDSEGFIYAMGGCGGTPAIYGIASGTWHAMSDPKPNSNCVGHATYDTSRNRLYVADGSSNAFYYQY
jgi:hypothetical protein